MSISSKGGENLKLLLFMLLSLCLRQGEVVGQGLLQGHCGGAGNDAVHSIIQSRTGKLLIAGQYDNGQLGQDGFVAIVDEQMPDTVIIRHTTQRPGNESINQILQASDGTFWGVGFLDEAGWIFRSKEIAALEFDFEDAAPERTGSNLLDLVQDKVGNIYATGYHNEQLLLMKWDAEGKAITGFPYRHPTPSVGTAIAVTDKNELLITGHLQGRRGHDSLLVLRVSALGEKMDEKHWPNAQGKAIQVDDQGKILVGGLTQQADLGESALLLQLREDGQLEEVDLPEQVGNSAILAIAKPMNNIWPLAGYSASYRPGAQRPVGFCNLVALDEAAFIRQDYFLGNHKRGSKAHAVLCTAEGAVYFAGTTHMGKKSGYEGTIAMRRRESPVESITFTQPLPSKAGGIVSSPNYEVEVQAIIRSTEPIQTTGNRNWNIIHKTVADGSKELRVFPEPQEITRKGANSNFWEYKITSTIILDKGLNSIKVTHKEGIWIDTSQSELLIDYRASKLFLLAIGIPYEDLLYTTNDAKAIGDIFAAQSEKQYRAFDSTILDSKEETTYQNIKSEVVKYSQLSSDNRIGKEDVLILFVSAHGISINNEFYLIPPDLPDNDKLTIASRGINFKDDILSKLEKINCTKIFLIDACYSGGGVEKVLKTMKNQNKTLAIASSQANQRSYEDEASGHGALTEGVLRAFDGEGVKKLDTNGDSLVDDKEFYDFIKKEVQEMVWKAKGKKQVPVMIKSKGDDCIIFRY